MGNDYSCESICNTSTTLLSDYTKGGLQNRPSAPRSENDAGSRQDFWSRSLQQQMAQDPALAPVSQEAPETRRLRWEKRIAEFHQRQNAQDPALAPVIQEAAETRRLRWEKRIEEHHQRQNAQNTATACSNEEDSRSRRSRRRDKIVQARRSEKVPKKIPANPEIGQTRRPFFEALKRKTEAATRHHQPLSSAQNYAAVPVNQINTRSQPLGFVDPVDELSAVFQDQLLTSDQNPCSSPIKTPEDTNYIRRKLTIHDIIKRSRQRRAAAVNAQLHSSDQSFTSAHFNDDDFPNRGAGFYVFSNATTFGPNGNIHRSAGGFDFYRNTNRGVVDVERGHYGSNFSAAMRENENIGHEECKPTFNDYYSLVPQDDEFAVSEQVGKEPAPELLERTKIFLCSDSTPDERNQGNTKFTQQADDCCNVATQPPKCSDEILRNDAKLRNNDAVERAPTQTTAEDQPALEHQATAEIFTNNELDLLTPPENIAAKTVETASVDIDERLLCVICLEREKGIMLKPCFHVCVCKVCIDQLTGGAATCPLCRQAIESVQIAYI